MDPSAIRFVAAMKDWTTGRTKRVVNSADSLSSFVKRRAVSVSVAMAEDVDLRFGAHQSRFFLQVPAGSKERVTSNKSASGFRLTRALSTDKPMLRFMFSSGEFDREIIPAPSCDQSLRRSFAEDQLFLPNFATRVTANGMNPRTPKSLSTSGSSFDFGYNSWKMERDAPLSTGWRFFDYILAWRFRSAHRHQKRNMVELTKLLLTSFRVPSSMFQGVSKSSSKMSRDALELFSSESISSRVFFVSRPIRRLIYKSCKKRQVDAASMQGTQKRCDGAYLDWTTEDWTTASASDVFPIPPGPGMHALEVCSSQIRWEIPWTKLSQPWKMRGWTGICCLARVFDAVCALELLRCVRMWSNLSNLPWRWSTCSATCSVRPWIFCNWISISIRILELRKSFESSPET